MSEDDIEKMQEQIEKESEEGDTGEVPGFDPQQPPPEEEPPPEEVPPQEVPPEELPPEEEEEFQMIT